MDATYKILGADGKEYGPVTLEQLKGWIGDSRVTGTTQVVRSDQSGWRTAAEMPELNLPAPAAAMPSTAPQPAAPMAASPEFEPVRRQLKSGASWFYWIAGLSLINSVAALFGTGYGFILGLGITRLIDGIAAAGLGSTGIAVAIVLDVLVAGVFILFGVFASKGYTWSFIAGMLLYAADGLLFMLIRDWLGLGFHAFALLCLFGGLRAARHLKVATAVR